MKAAETTVHVQNMKAVEMSVDLYMLSYYSILFNT